MFSCNSAERFFKNMRILSHSSLSARCNSQAGLRHPRRLFKDTPDLAKLYATTTAQRAKKSTLFIRARQKGDSKWEKPVSAKICGFLRFPAKICGFLRFSAQICDSEKSLDLQSEPKISENLQKSAKMCVPGPVSPFCCLPFGAPWIRIGSPKLPGYGIWIGSIERERERASIGYEGVLVRVPSIFLLRIGALVRTGNDSYRYLERPRSWLSANSEPIFKR